MFKKRLVLVNGKAKGNVKDIFKEIQKWDNMLKLLIGMLIHHKLAAAVENNAQSTTSSFIFPKNKYRLTH